MMLLDHLPGRVLADLRVVRAGMKIKVDAKETVCSFEPLGNGRPGC